MPIKISTAVSLEFDNEPKAYKKYKGPRTVKNNFEKE